MVTVLILGIVATAGTQTYSQLVEQARANTTINELFYHLAYARSEAIKRNSPVALCASQDGATCMDAKSLENWSYGFILFENKNDDRQKQKTEKLLLVHGKIHKDDKLYFKPGRPGRGILQFTPLGGISDNASSFLYCPSGKRTRAKAIFLSRIGRPRIGSPEEKHVCGN